jgi:GDP-L-galactose phosphorylase
MPLKLSRVGTVYSMTQLEEGGEGKPVAPPAPAAAPQCPVSELRASLLPLYRFPAADGFSSKRIRSFGDLHAAGVPDVDRPSSDDDAALEGSSDSGSASSGRQQVVPQRSVLDALLLAEWEDRAEAGLFRYDVTACPTRVLGGAYGFVAQLNEGRASKKRPTEFLVDQVDQPFDAGKFHFGKALQREALFQFQPGPGRAPSFTPAAPAADSPNLVFINVSPIEYGHVLLVPRALENLNQLVTPGSAMLALQFAREGANPYLRVGFNSLGAYGTINHLHFQAYYLAAPMALERAPTEPLRAAPSTPRCRKRGVRVCRLTGYPVRGLVFEAGDSLAELATMVGRACERLTAANVPHNMMIVDRGARVFLLPNAFAERKARGELPEGERQLEAAAVPAPLCGPCSAAALRASRP